MFVFPGLDKGSEWSSQLCGLRFDEVDGLPRLADEFALGARDPRTRSQPGEYLVGDVHVPLSAVPDELYLGVDVVAEQEPVRVPGVEFDDGVDTGGIRRVRIPPIGTPSSANGARSTAVGR